MKKVTIELQTAKDIRNILKLSVCKNKQKHECDYASAYYNKMQREFNCRLCPIKCIDRKLKEVIEKGE